MYVHAIIAALDQVLTVAQRMIVNITQYEYENVPGTHQCLR